VGLESGRRKLEFGASYDFYAGVKCEKSVGVILRQELERQSILNKSQSDFNAKDYKSSEKHE
jgi:hypothetical protein